ncbi:hypothetical protein LCGC14_0278340 [marine sediment metagenome]|uniref:Uncharacterized protein n=1 Tax=marine sediment metagenome TaxID=412755 RepID=A0A0F9WHU4_9ZZZZ
MEKSESIVANIFEAAEERELNDVSISICKNLKFTLYAGKKDRFECASLKSLLQSIKEHDNLAWMN